MTRLGVVGLPPAARLRIAIERARAKSRALFAALAKRRDELARELSRLNSVGAEPGAPRTRRERASIVRRALNLRQSEHPPCC